MHSSGHAIVIAGPGTGKTTTLVARFHYLISKGVDPSSIMVVTFTQKASEELKSRLGNKLPKNALIGTFHSLSTRFLRKYGKLIGLKDKFKILDPNSQKDIIKQICYMWNEDDGDIIEIIGRWKDLLLKPEDVLSSAISQRMNDSVLKKARDCYSDYQSELSNRGDLDFSDLIIKATELFNNNDFGRKNIKNKITNILVDEFQDVNISQVEFLKSLVKFDSNIWAVGDDDQALYAWRGSDVKFIVQFKEYFKNSTLYMLEENYRCQPFILNSALKLINYNTYRYKKNIIPVKKQEDGKIINIRFFDNEKDEASWISRQCIEDINNGINPHKISVLFRTASLVPVIQQNFEKNNVNFTISGASNFWSMPEVKAVSQIIEAIEKKDFSTYHIRTKGVRDIIATMGYMKPNRTAIAVGKIVADAVPLGVSSERFSLWMDMAEAAAMIASDFSSSKELNEYMRQMSSLGNSENGVSMSTIHSSKGLEWNKVYLCGCESSLMPHAKSIDIEEERRLMYVALTRSTGSVEITFVNNRFGKAQKPSPFIFEIFPELLQKFNNNFNKSNINNNVIKNEEIKKVSGVFRRRGGKTLISPEDDIS